MGDAANLLEEKQEYALVVSGCAWTVAETEGFNVSAEEEPRGGSSSTTEQDQKTTTTVDNETGGRDQFFNLGQQTVQEDRPIFFETVTKHRLTTIFSSSHVTYGVMFDIVGKEDINIYGLDLHFNEIKKKRKGRNMD